MESSRQFQIQGDFLSRGGAITIDILVRVMNAVVVRVGGKDFDVSLLTVVMVKEWT